MRYKLLQKQQGYLRWRKQFRALVDGDLSTVKKLAREASRVLEEKKERSLRLPFTY